MSKSGSPSTPGRSTPCTTATSTSSSVAVPLFDEVVVAVLLNEGKKPLFSVEERIEMIRDMVDGDVRVESFSGLLVDFMDRVGGRAVVRGLRAVSDFEYELQMALMNRRLNPRVETVFMMPHDDYTYLSSRLVKEVFALGGDLTGLVPEPVIERLRRRLRSGGGAEADQETRA